MGVALWSEACFEVFMLIAVVLTSSPCSTSFSKLLNVLNRVTSNQIVKRNMAWRSHGSTNEELVTKLRANGVISSDKVEQVMKSIDRGDFCKKGNRALDVGSGS